MADAMEIDETSTKQQPPLKRKREKQKLKQLSPEERDSKLKTLNEEVESLLNYFDEVMSDDLDLDSLLDGVKDGGKGAKESMVALLLEEKRCNLEILVDEIYEKLKERVSGVTIASLKADVLDIGHRVSYGVPIGDADFLLDETRSHLWCWETRDAHMKLLPSSVRGALYTRRKCRTKIKERITAVLDVISSLQKAEDHPTCKIDRTKAFEKLNKVLAEADIRLFVQSLNQKNDCELDEKEAKKKMKELEKSKRQKEKEKKKMDREHQKEKLQSEKEQKRLQQEAERDEKRREKEESETRKQLKRKQEEAEREQRRKEKEEADKKKQLSLQKQASIMERFLKKSKTTSTSQSDQSPKVVTSNESPSDSLLESVSLMMDSALQQREEIDVDEIRKSHMSSWHCLGRSIRSNPKQRWGLRHKPKTALFKELKLTSNDGPARDDDLWKDNIVDGWGQLSTDDKVCQVNTSASPCTSKHLPRKQLLQFDKSHRPAFYGSWPKKSHVIGARHPLRKDPDLDYDIDSDEEWEEEDPGESLSDSEKEEEENLDEGSLKIDDDDEESEDDFFVPDGYLSENEGVDTDRSQSNVVVDVTDGSLGCKPEALSEEYTAWMRQQKYLHNLTEHALKKNQPLIIVNMMHDKASLLSAEDLTGNLKVEQMCLQALSMRAFPGGLSIEVPSDTSSREENQEACTSNSKSSSAATGSPSTALDSDLPKIVSIIQTYPQGINRVLESLQLNFPDIPKTHLRNKVREISDFVDNRWKVKKEILVKLGMSTSPEKNGRTKSIAAFFSKRCLPPSGHAVNPCESSPESIKRGSSSQQPPLQERSENV